MHVIEREVMNCMFMSDIWNCSACGWACERLERKTFIASLWQTALDLGVCVVDLFLFEAAFGENLMRVFVCGRLAMSTYTFSDHLLLFVPVSDCISVCLQKATLPEPCLPVSHWGRSGWLLAKLSTGPLTPRTFTSSKACSARVTLCPSGPRKTPQKEQNSDW